MTEQEWLTATDPAGMLDFMQSGIDRRKLRLFACACCRHAWNPFVTPFTIRVVAVAEAFADGEVSESDMDRVRTAARAAYQVSLDTSSSGTGYLVHVALAAFHVTSPLATVIGFAPHAAPHSAARAAADLPVDPESGNEQIEEYVAELAAQADLFRDIFGNPFQSVGIELEWLTETVVALARQMYESRDFSAIPILADALQDAGCDDEDILGHCRLPREHARGCWVVDLLLGKS